MTDNFDFESFKQAAIKGIYEGKPLTGENGLFAPLLKHFLESALEEKMDSHLSQTRQTEQNRRNGETSKTVKSSADLLDLTTPRDRSGSYQPQTVGRCHRTQTAGGSHSAVGTEGFVALQHGQ